MKLFSVSIGLLFAALGVFFVPISFSVDGFGLVVNPGGVRTVRAIEAGTVLHFAPDSGRFLPGQIVTAVIEENAVADNTLLLGSMQRELSKIESDHLDKTSKIVLDLERDRAKRTATAQRLSARVELTRDTAEVLAALQEFTTASESDIDSLNAERMEQLARLEDLVKRSGEVSALPEQRLATMLEDIQGERLSVITSKGTRFSSDKMVLDMVKGLNDLSYSNAIDEAEVEILSNRVRDLEQQRKELEELRRTARAEAEARYLAKAVRPQVAISNGLSVDMRTLQASRADVSKGDALRLLATRAPMAGVSFLIYGIPAASQAVIRHDSGDLSLDLTAEPQQIAEALRAAGLNVADVHLDAEAVGSVDVLSIFVELGPVPPKRLSVMSTKARDADGRPVLVVADVSLPDAATAGQETGTEIIGFLENRHAVVLQPGQRVRGSISDTRTGSEIVFDARLLSRDYSTVDTKELGIRLGNASLADKIIKRGVLSQVVVGVNQDSAQQIEHLPGAVVHLSFPLARQSLFTFLLARDAAI